LELATEQAHVSRQQLGVEKINRKIAIRSYVDDEAFDPTFVLAQFEAAGNSYIAISLEG
jgi:hypothetical protein